MLYSNVGTMHILMGGILQAAIGVRYAKIEIKVF